MGSHCALFMRQFSVVKREDKITKVAKKPLMRSRMKAPN
ncbi:hypothetical protein VCLMA_A0780 [Vibrio cholerae LMA3984-4]|nr:hypothetical protein VCLMA_A0780 [Vibrio cholerae LMA3984-4]